MLMLVRSLQATQARTMCAYINFKEMVTISLLLHSLYPLSQANYVHWIIKIKSFSFQRPLKQACVVFVALP
jgi:hypothetical protein